MRPEWGWEIWVLVSIVWIFNPPLREKQKINSGLKRCCNTMTCSPRYDRMSLLTDWKMVSFFYSAWKSHRHNCSTFHAMVPFWAYIHFQGHRAQSPLLTWHKDSLCRTERLLSSNQTRGITEASTSFQNKNTTGGKSSGMSGIPKCCSLSSPAYLYLSSKPRPDSLSQSQSPVGMHRHNSTITSHGRDVRLHRQQLPSRNKLWINF